MRKILDSVAFFEIKGGNVFFLPLYGFQTLQQAVDAWAVKGTWQKGAAMVFEYFLDFFRAYAAAAAELAGNTGQLFKRDEPDFLQGLRHTVYILKTLEIGRAHV